MSNETETKKEEKQATTETLDSNTSGLGVMSTIDKCISPANYSRMSCPRLFICHPNRSQGLLSF